MRKCGKASSTNFILALFTPKNSTGLPPSISNIRSPDTAFIYIYFSGKDRAKANMYKDFLYGLNHINMATEYQIMMVFFRR
jgi:hypothetical protein